MLTFFESPQFIDLFLFFDEFFGETLQTSDVTVDDFAGGDDFRRQKLSISRPVIVVVDVVVVVVVVPIGRENRKASFNLKNLKTKTKKIIQ